MSNAVVHPNRLHLGHRIGCLGSAAAALLLLSGCASLGEPASFADMESRLASLGSKLPDEFVHIGSHQGGKASSWFGPPSQFVGHTYSARWNDGEMCAQLESFARDLGSVTPIGDSGCYFSVAVVAGPGGWIGGAWRYRLVMRAHGPLDAAQIEQLCAKSAAETRASREATESWSNDCLQDVGDGMAFLDLERL